MSINSTITKELSKVEKILTKSGLYKQFTYTDKTYVETNYNPITGDHESTSSSTDYTFNGIPLTTRSDELQESAFSILLDVVVMASNITFEMRPGLEFVLGGQVWNVSTFKLNPADSVYEIVLGRK
jgi:hypothetical protein